MKEVCMPNWEYDKRSELVRKVLDWDLLQMQANVTRYGTYWGNRANVALMCMARGLLVDRVLSRDVPLGEVERLVDDYVRVDLRVFTQEAESCFVTDLPLVRWKMQEQAQRYACPVVAKVREKNIRDWEAFVLMLEDAIKRVGLPSDSDEEIAGTKGGAVNA